MSPVTAADVMKLTKPTDGFLCALSDNTFGLDFLKFTISDYDTKKVIFRVSKDGPPPQDVSMDFSALGEDMYRKIRYKFSEDVLRLPFIQTSLVFGVGKAELRGFRMIERHYFRDQLVKSFDFEFGFCIPGSINTWDAVYAVPPLKDSLIEQMIANPHETRSDSFYFVDDKLIMHNKAAYEYIREDAAQSKRSYEDKYGYIGAKGGAKASSKATSGTNSNNRGTGAAKKEIAPVAMDVESDGTSSVTNGVASMNIADSKDTPGGSGSNTIAPAKATAGAKVAAAKSTNYF